VIVSGHIDPRPAHQPQREQVIGPRTTSPDLRYGPPMGVLRVARFSGASSVLLRFLSGVALVVTVGVLEVCLQSYASAASTEQQSESASEQARRAAEIYKSTMSPFCPGRTVDACPSPYATEWREDIRKWVAEGVATDEIRRRLKARSDQDLTGAPSTAMDGIMPFAATALSLVLLGLLLRLLIKPMPPKDATPSKPDANKSGATAAQDDADLDTRLKRELDALDD
jgi:cytochrome c-type biogenesis protein CcmH/NrfF